MSELTIPTESPFDDGRIACPQGGEDKWSARWLMTEMGYPTWQHFEPVIERAKVAAHNQGFNVKILFTVDREKTGGRPSLDYRVTRFAAYLIAMNGDPRKSEVAAAQAYFAVRTREAEIAKPLTGKELLAAAVLEAQATIAAKDAEIATLAPKASYVDIFVAGSDLLTFRTVASTLDVGEQWLRQTLIEKNWIYAEHSSRWSDSKGKVPQTRYSEYAAKKLYFRRVEAHDAPRFNGEVMHSLKITAAGANAIAKAVARWQGQVAA